MYDDNCVLAVMGDVKSNHYIILKKIVNARHFHHVDS